MQITKEMNETTRKQTFIAAALVGVLAFAAGAQAQDTMSPLVKQMFTGGWPDKAAVEQLNRDRLYYDAIEAYRLNLPALNTIGMRDGSEAKFGKGYNVLPIWKDRMNAKTWVPTPNCDVIYSMSYLDLKATGPLVVYAPPDVIGMFTDFFQRTITDVGAIGPDRARGGLYLLLPPDHQGHVPAGYFAFKSETYNVFLFFRTVMKPGADGPDPTEAVARAEMTRVYPLDLVEKERKPMQFPNGSNIRVNMMYPTDFSYWEKLKAFVDYEPVESIAPEVRGILASIGIIKGVPFRPDGATREALSKAVETAPKMIIGVAARRPGRRQRPLLHRPAVYQRVGRHRRRVVPQQLPRREPARILLPGRLLLGAGDGDGHDQCGLEVSEHAVGQGR